MAHFLRADWRFHVGSANHPSGSAGVETGQTRFCIDYSLIPDSAVLRSHDLCIIAVTAQVDLPRLKEGGRSVLAYASMVEVQPGSREAEAAKKRGIPVIGDNPNWNSTVLDITHPQWLPWVLEDSGATGHQAWI